MQETLRRIRARGANGDRGFTLIELLVVVVIIGILVAIATPTYLNYRKGAANKSAASDVRGAITSVEQFYTDNNVYPDDVNGTKGSPLTLTTSGGTAGSVAVSAGNTLKFRNYDTYYVICAQNDDGKTVYVYNSQNGGSVKKSAHQDSLDDCADTGA